jgi:hypothetical protein
MQYGVAIDPSKPDKCMLALGDESLLWRFDYLTGEPGCGTSTVSTPPIDQLYCNGAPDPTKFQWTGFTVSTPGAAGTLTVTQGTVTVYSGPVSSSASVFTAPAVGATPLTASFTPASGSPSAIDVHFAYTSDKNPEICYQAKVIKCGPVSNIATMAAAGGVAKENATAELNFGDATGEACTPGLLKVCKVAGPGIAVGTPFTFNAGSSTMTVPAGPAPGGTCVVGPSLAVGTAVTVAENVPAGVTVSNITVAPPSQQVGLPNLTGGSVNITMGTGVTEVTFTDKLTGYIEICKKGHVTGNYSFNISPGGIGPIIVPAGACSPAIQVVAGPVIVTETPSPGAVMSGCSAYPAGQQLGCNTSAGSSTVNVAPGNISTMTIAFIENKPVQPH